jgi:hypothetical protein
MGDPTTGTNKVVRNEEYTSDGFDHVMCTSCYPEYMYEPYLSMCGRVFPGWIHTPPIAADARKCPMCLILAPRPCPKCGMGGDPL